MKDIQVGDGVIITGGELAGLKGVVTKITDDPAFDGGKRYEIMLGKLGLHSYCRDWLQFEWGFRGAWKDPDDPVKAYDRAMRGI